MSPLSLAYINESLANSLENSIEMTELSTSNRGNHPRLSQRSWEDWSLPLDDKVNHQLNCQGIFQICIWEWVWTNEESCIYNTGGEITYWVCSNNTLYVVEWLVGVVRYNHGGGCDRNGGIVLREKNRVEVTSEKERLEYIIIYIPARHDMIDSEW